MQGDVASATVSVTMPPRDKEDETTRVAKSLPSSDAFSDFARTPTTKRSEASYITDADLPLVEENGEDVLYMYWLDVHEDARSHPGAF